MAALRAHVVRDDAVERGAGAELVPGDVVLLETGSIVPADLRLAERRCSSRRRRSLAIGDGRNPPRRWPTPTALPRQRSCNADRRHRRPRHRRSHRHGRAGPDRHAARDHREAKSRCSSGSRASGGSSAAAIPSA
jgi:hypothetical protein